MFNFNDQAKLIFLEAVEEIPRDRWGEFVVQRCAGDVSLQNQVHELLAAHSALERPIEKGPDAVDLTSTAEDAHREEAGQAVDPEDCRTYYPDRVRT